MELGEMVAVWTIAIPESLGLLDFLMMLEEPTSTATVTVQEAAGLTTGLASLKEVGKLMIPGGAKSGHHSLLHLDPCR
jgi:hypothetical protein